MKPRLKAGSQRTRSVQWRRMKALPHFLRIASLLLVAWSARAGEFKVGAAAVVITPPPGTPMAGYYHFRAAEGVLDDLFAKAIVVEQDGEKAAFVGLDLITVTRPVAVEARELIAKETGIAPERVMISATHSHTGPVLNRRSGLDEISGASTPAALHYSERLPELIARAVSDANARLGAARASTAVGREETLSFNRRFWMNDGTVSWNPAKFSPNVVAPAGPIDPEVGILYFETNAKAPVPLATYVNFALHPDVVGGSSISADYPGCLAARLADFKGAEMVTLFANGCCGNINHRNIWWADPQKSRREADRIGTVLAAAVMKTWPELKPLVTYAPHSRSRMVTLPLPRFSELDAAEARTLGAQMKDPKLGTVAKAKAVSILDTLAREGKPLEAEVQAIALSDELAIVALPGEIFVELGLALKKASPFKNTFIAELANGSIGYIPNRAAYGEGNYEVVSARCGEGSGELLIEAALELLRELRTSRAP
ncbi:MAG: Neutral ceramidase [Chthoniobacter sp.]|jgi:hypothetical protein|nr:Neutral ceramidase [Chthoniobacter sp.]